MIITRLKTQLKIKINPGVNIPNNFVRADNYLPVIINKKGGDNSLTC